MTNFIVRLATLIAALLMTLLGFAKTHDVGGRVIDEKGEPMPYVNVVLLSLPDSAFVQGAMTDEQGMFRIVTDKNEGLLKVSSVGYETIYMTAADGLTIQMKEDTQVIGEVVVKGQLPKTHVKGDAMRTTVAGTILEKAGTVSDALKRIPSLEADRDGGVKVLGRGDAEVYINGRRMQDASELTRLRSDQIQHVDVVQNPGARYAASTKAVVRITLKKAQGEGISFRDNAGYVYKYGNAFTNNLDVNYRTGGLDITASLWAGDDRHYKGLQDNDLLYFVGPDRIDGYTTQETTHDWKGFSPQLQVNYMVDENHSFGAFYKYDRRPSGELKSFFCTDSYENGTFTEHSESDIWQDESFNKHIFNAYYNGKVGQLGIDLNIDGLFDDTKAPGSTAEQTTAVGEMPVNRKMESNTISGNNFWASKLIFTYPVLRGNLSVGGEYSYNHRTDAYDFTSTDALPVKTTDTEINEKSVAAFAEYGRPFGKVFVQAGLRYEHLKNDYFNFGVREDEVCRDYGDWFPTALITAPIGKVQMSLSYRRDIQRPAYSNLTSSTIYLNRYAFQSGNPYLLPTYTHSLVLNAGYKWTNLTLNYSRIKNVLTLSTEPYPGSDDPLISLVRPINSSEDYSQMSVSLSASPTIGCWHPMWYVYCLFQNYKSLTAEGSVITLNRPYLTLAWQNDIELPKGFRLNALMQWATHGDYNNNRITACRFYSGIGIQRDFNLRSLGTLTADLRCQDIFNTDKTDAIIYGIRQLSVRNPARRRFSLDLTWKFNEARSKYRGSGAGEKQKARM
ncbi:MAG: outer membrane beta-barrel protein [Prevotella sp.]|nr:outer membrane beta-barrel protein [Prevotella sp.]